MVPTHVASFPKPIFSLGPSVTTGRGPVTSAQVKSCPAPLPPSLYQGWTGAATEACAAAPAAPEGILHRLKSGLFLAPLRGHPLTFTLEVLPAGLWALALRPGDSPSEETPPLPWQIKPHSSKKGSGGGIQGNSCRSSPSAWGSSTSAGNFAGSGLDFY